MPTCSKAVTAMRFSPSTARSLLLRKSSDSSYLRLDQLLSSLIRVAVLRLCCEGIYSLTSSQIASGDGLLYLALQKQIAG